MKERTATEQVWDRFWGHRGWNKVMEALQNELNTARAAGFAECREKAVAACESQEKYEYSRRRTSGAHAAHMCTGLIRQLLPTAAAPAQETGETG